MILLNVLVIAACVLINVQSEFQFRVFKEWKYVNYTWENEEQFRNFTATGRYNPGHCIMSGLGYYKGNYFITIPRMFVGVPATLSWIADSNNTAPNLNPFPSWAKNTIGECDALQNVQNIQIDSDGMLYVIDSGRTNTLNHSNHKQVCPAKLVKYDLNTPDGANKAKMVYTYVFPDSVVPRNINYLYDLVIDDNFLYISDNSAHDPALIVFDEKEMRSWKIRHGTFRADSKIKAINVSGTVIDAQLNLAGLALGPETEDGRLLYYSPLSSYTLFAVNTNELKNPNRRTIQNVLNIGEKSSTTDGMIMDDQGMLYLGQLETSSIVQWDTKKPYRLRLIAQDPKYVQWPNSFAFNDAGNLVVLTNTLAKFVKNTADLNEPNFYLLTANVSAHSYVVNRFKYKDVQGHVHFHPVDLPLNDTDLEVPDKDTSSVEVSVNDLLLPDDENEIIEAENSSATGIGGFCYGIMLILSFSAQITHKYLHSQILL